MRAQIEAEISECDLKDRIQLTGWLSIEEVLAWLAESDILFMPSYYEGLPVTGIQALAMGMAVVASNIGGFIDLVDEGKNGYLIEVNDSEGYANALSKLLTDQNRLLRFRMASCEKAKEFDIEKIAKKYERAFLSISGKTKKETMPLGRRKIFKRIRQPLTISERTIIPGKQKSKIHQTISKREEKSRWRPKLLRIFGTLLALILLVILLSQQGWNEIITAVKEIPLWRISLAVGLMIVSRLSVVARWHVLLRTTEARLPFTQSLRITFAGLFATNFLPTTIGGDVVRLAGALQQNLDSALITASLIVDRLVGLMGMTMAVPLGLPRLMAVRTNTYLPWQDFDILAAWTINFPFRKLWKSARNKAAEFLHQMADALAVWLKSPHSLLLALAFSWLHMVCIFVIIQQFLVGMGENMSIWLVGGLYSLVYLVTLLPISVNGLGVQEVSMTFFLSSLGGVSVNSSLAAALLFRTLMMLASTPGAFFLPDMLDKKKKHQSEVDSH
jgi:uncharacterized membrane protein YbhN (UPF0104 family)